MLDLRTGKVCKTLIPKVKIVVWKIVYQCLRLQKVSLTSLPSSMRPTSSFFTTTGLTTIPSLHIFFTLSSSGRKTIRAFRRKDGKIIANFRVQVQYSPAEAGVTQLLHCSRRQTSRGWRPLRMEGWPVTSHQSPVSCWQSPVASHQSPVSCWPVASHQSPVSCWPVTSCLPQVCGAGNGRRQHDDPHHR